MNCPAGHEEGMTIQFMERSAKSLKSASGQPSVSFADSSLEREPWRAGRVARPYGYVC